MNKKICMAASICICMFISACGNDKAVKDAPELLEPVMSAANTVKAEIGDIDNTEVLTAEIIPHTEELSFAMEGTVDTVFVNIGDHVRKGDKLAVLKGGVDNEEQRDIDSRIDSGKKSNEVDNLELEYDIEILKSERKLLEDKVKKASGKEKKELRKELDINKADIKIAEQNLANQKEIQQIEMAELRRKKELIDDGIKDYYIYSTIDGVVSYIGIQRGVSAAKGKLAIAVSDGERKYVRSAFVTDKKYRSAQRCYIMYNGREYDVAMRPYNELEMKELAESGISPYSYYGFEDTEGVLGVGTYVDLRLESQSGSGVLILPVNAVYTENNKSYVYKNIDGRKVMTEIKKGIVNSSYVEIVSGLSEGDEVYVKP